MHWLKYSKWRTMLWIVSVIVLYELYRKVRRRVKKYPAGPTSIFSFVLMCKMLLTKRKIDVMTLNDEMCKYYGDRGIWMEELLSLKVCKISSSKVAKQVLNHKHALNRPIFGDGKSEIHIENTADGTAPFSNLNGKQWEKRRKLSKAILFRMCTASFVNKIMDEAITNVVFPTLNELASHNQVWYPMKLMRWCAFNTVFYANYGRHIAIDDPLYEEMIAVITETFELFQPGLVYSVLPKYALLLIKLNPFSAYHKILKLIERRSRIGQRFKEQRANQPDKNPNEEAVYYVDYIHKELTDSEVEADMGALLGAGADTTSSTLNFAIVLAAKYVDIQQRVRSELMECYRRNTKERGNDSLDLDGIKRFDMNWIHQLTVFRAFIHEVVRVSSVTKLGLPHGTAKDIEIELDGQGTVCIPKDSVVIYVIELMHKNADAEHWVDSSDNMCLENWINRETKKFEVNESFFTFGTGRRDCVGRNLAIKELYIVMAYLLLNYKFAFQNENDRHKPIRTSFEGVNQIDPPIPVVVTRL